MASVLTRPDAESVQRAALSAQTVEALGNYQDGDTALNDRPQENVDRIADYDLKLDSSDEAFWWRCLNVSRELEDGKNVYLYDAALSEWIPRVPGLFWTPASRKMREATKEQVQSHVNGWTTFTPEGKSMMVSGGVGTIRLPPDNSGYRLVSLSASFNASSGVPLLVSPEVWEKYRLREGCVVIGNAQLRRIPGSWAREFPTVKGIPKICLELRDPEFFHVTHRTAPVLVHPFSIMEYWDKNAQLIDFVYASGETSDRDFHRRFATFFEAYRKEYGREGVYLTSADVSQPMWRATFSSPGDMRGKDAQVRLIEARAEGNVRNDKLIRQLMEQLGAVPSTDDLKRLSNDADIPWRRWFRGGSIPEEVAHLIDAAVSARKLLPLSQATYLELLSNNPTYS